MEHMDDLVREVQRVEERQYIKKLAMSKCDANSWSKTQMVQAIVLLDKHLELDTTTDLYHLTELHRKLLQREPEKSFELGEKLLTLLSSKNVSADKRISTFRNNCYAYHWNYMRQDLGSREISLNLRICFLALRFSLTHSVTNLASVVNRLQQTTQIIQKVDSVQLFVKSWEKLIKALKNSFVREFGKGKFKPESETQQMEENFVQLLLTFSRQCTTVCPTYSGIDRLVSGIQKIAQHYIAPALKVDLAVSHISNRDGLTTLKVLANYLDKHHSILTAAVGIFDVFEFKAPWKSWTQQWVIVKRENRDLETKNVYDLLSHENMAQDYSVFLSKALRCEINAYFCSKIVLPDALIGAGQALEDHPTNYVDTAIGLLAQGIGFWFGPSEEHEEFALDLCLDAVKALDKGNPKTMDEQNIAGHIVASAVYAWTGFCTLKQLQTRSAKDLKAFQEYDMRTNPSRYKGFDEDEGPRIIPGVSSVTLKDEFDVVTWVKKSANTMYNLIQYQDKFEEELKGVCPSMLLVTMRLVVHTLTSFGDHIASIKAWQVVRALSAIVGNKLSTLFSGAELMKQFPHLNPKLASEIEAEFQAGWDVNESILRTAKPYLLRYNLSKSIVAFYNKDYQNGLNHLKPLVEFRFEKDNFDISHHVMAETYFLISQYRALDPALNLDFSLIPEALRDMSPVCLATKAFKHLAGMARPPTTRQSGWSDLLHNSFMLSSMMQMGPEIIEIFKLNGRIREMRIFAADFVYLTQQLAYVSRTAQCLVYIAEADMLGKHFDSAELKIVSLDSIFSREIIEGSGNPGNRLRRNNILETLQKFGIAGDHKRLINVPDELFTIKSVQMPDSHYAKGERNSEKSELFPPLVHKFKTPNFLFHSLKCNCYVCLHPTIVPVTIQYLLLLANYSMYNKDSVSAQLIQTASRHHLRGMFRVIHNFSTLTLDFKDYFTLIGAKSALDKMYIPFFSEPVAKSLLLQMELCPPDNILFTFQAHKNYLEVCNLVKPGDLVVRQKSFDSLTSAMFLFLYSNGTYEIQDSKIREIMQEYMVKHPPSFPNAVSPEVPAESTDRPCPPGPRKGLRSQVRAAAIATANANAHGH